MGRGQVADSCAARRGVLRQASAVSYLETEPEMSDQAPSGNFALQIWARVGGCAANAETAQAAGTGKRRRGPRGGQQVQWSSQEQQGYRGAGQVCWRTQACMGQQLKSKASQVMLLQGPRPAFQGQQSRGMHQGAAAAALAEPAVQAPVAEGAPGWESCASFRSSWLYFETAAAPDVLQCSLLAQAGEEELTSACAVLQVGVSHLLHHQEPPDQHHLQ